MDTRVSTRKSATKSKIAAAGDHAVAADGAQLTSTEISRRLERAVARIEDLTRQLFELQEQNQQLRKDLASGVCPRLCTRPYRSAS